MNIVTQDPLPLLSRVAESVYWMARYIERAENVSRYITVNLNLQLDLPMDPADQWQPLIDITGDTEVFKERFGEATQANVLHFLTYDAENPSSIFNCLRGARENARSVRETLTQSMWEHINGMYLDMLSHRHRGLNSGPLEDFFGPVRIGCHSFQGITDATMSHDEAWHFSHLGRMLERADQTSRILDVKYFLLLPSVRDVGTPYDDIHWSAVLKSVSAFGMYRRKHGRIAVREIVDFLTMDREFPRSIHFCIRSADESLHAITGTPPGSFHYPSEQAIGMLRATLDYTSVESVMQQGLHEYLDVLQAKLNSIDAAVRGDFIDKSAEEQAGAQRQRQGKSRSQSQAQR